MKNMTALLVLSMMLGVPASLSAATFTVSNTNDAGAGSLRQAISDANILAGADIIVFGATFNTPQTILLTTGELGITQAVTITGSAVGVTVSGNNASRVFSIAATIGAVTLDNLTITGGNTSGNGGGIVNNGTLTMTNCTVSSNAATSGNGGGIDNSNTLTMTNCTVSGNASNNFGGGILNNVTLTMTNCTVSGNTSNVGGGGIFNFNTLTMTNCTVSGNTSNVGGGIVSGGTLTLINCTVSGNSASNEGGGIRNLADLNLRNTAVVFNTAPTNANLSGGTTTSVTSLIVNPGSYPFHSPRNLRPLPTAASLIASGTTGAPTPASDRDGTPRSNPPTIGAYEAVAATPAVSGTATASGGTLTQSNIGGTGISLNLTGVVPATATFTAQRYNTGRSGTIAAANASPYYWIVSTTATTIGVSSSASFDWSGITANGVSNPATIQLFRRSGFGSAWTSAVTGGSGSSITLTGITDFSEFALGGSVDNPLPVTLQSFIGSASTVGVSLGWNTASETGNAGFSILRDGTVIADYESIASLRGQGTTTSASSYSFIDATVEAGRAYTYRLRSHDQSGTVHDYPQTVTVEVKDAVQSKPAEYALMQNYPNPFNPQTVIRFTMKQAGQATLIVTDMLGRTVISETLSAGAGVNQYRFDGSKLTSGTYFYQLRAAGFSETRKMMLVK